MTDETSSLREVWEKEVIAKHRWGQHGNKAAEELSRLRRLWDSIHPVDYNTNRIIDQVVALEICNWNLEESILSLCRAIGNKRPAEIGIGHLDSMTEGRWRKIWTYYYTLRNWLPCQNRNGYRTLLREYDPDKAIQNHIDGLLGDRNGLKELYVTRFCFCLDFWLGGYYPQDSAQKIAHDNAVSAIEQEIEQRDPSNDILKAFQLEGDGKLNPCHHKLFRRYDIIISSIGAGRWRVAMPMKGTNGFDRADTLETHLAPIELWVKNRDQETTDEGLSGKIISSLGKRDDTKVFLVSLLLSLLRSQQAAARQRAERRTEKRNN